MDTTTEETQQKINFVLISTCRTSHLTFHLFVRAESKGARKMVKRWKKSKIKARVDGSPPKRFFLHPFIHRWIEWSFVAFSIVLNQQEKKSSTTSWRRIKYQFFISNQWRRVEREREKKKLTEWNTF